MYGQLAMAGKGKNGTVSAHSAAALAVTNTTSNQVSGLDFTSAFQLACSKAANKTSSITPVDIDSLHLTCQQNIYLEPA
ncbi:hypothetical protein GCM10027093_08070 [Paraburkholderia jirisanensis]